MRVMECPFGVCVFFTQCCGLFQVSKCGENPAYDRGAHEGEFLWASRQQRLAMRPSIISQSAPVDKERTMSP